MSDSRKTSASSEITVKELTFYYEEMVRSHLMELEVETHNGKIVLKRLGAADSSAKSPATLRRKTDVGLDQIPESSSSSAQAITSPIMGVFYRASSPQSPPLVKEGDTVNVGTTLCIVEAMKVMNEIKSDNRCRIMKILAENGKPVTKNQPLFHIEPL